MYSDMKYPLVSIVITSYNRSRTIAQAIESALGQSYPNIEVIISDNHSTDGSDEVISHYTDDPKVIYSRNDSNIGMVPNFKKAIYELCHGEYFVIVNSDDYLINNNFISDAISLVNKYEDIFIVKGKFKLLSEETGYITNSQYIIKEEWHNGREWLHLSDELPFNQIYETLGWSAILINRAEFTKLEIFNTGSYNLDVCSGVLLLMKGNICFVDEYSYMFRTLSDRQPYHPLQTKEIYMNIFKATDFLINHEFNKIYQPDLDKFYNKFYRHIIEYYMYLVYRNDKKHYLKFKEYLLIHHGNIFNEIKNTWHWRLYTIVHCYPSLGKLISKLKNGF
jgi:glycosyltransferase involved in cell wall biosynthesis